MTTIPHRVYRGTGIDFDLYKTILGEGTWDWEIVSIGSHEYLYNLRLGPLSSGSYQTPSEVYNFD